MKIWKLYIFQVLKLNADQPRNLFLFLKKKTIFFLDFWKPARALHFFGAGQRCSWGGTKFQSLPHSQNREPLPTWHLDSSLHVLHNVAIDAQVTPDIYALNC